MADDARSFDEFYRATSRRLMHFAYAMTGDLATAQDLTQDAYMRAWRHWQHVGGLDRPESWLRLVVTRLATDRWRRLRVATRLMPRRSLVTPAPSEDSVLVAAALRSLPPAQRRAISLYYLLDLSIAEIATESNVSQGTVKSWLSRGRKALAGILSPEMFETSSTPGQEQSDAHVR